MTAPSLSDLRLAAEYTARSATIHFQRCRAEGVCARCDDLNGEAADAEDAYNEASRQTPSRVVSIGGSVTAENWRESEFWAGAR